MVLNEPCFMHSLSTVEHRVFIAEQIFVQQLVSKKTGVTVIVRVSQKQMSLHHSQHTFE